MITLSISMIVKNESEVLARCLDSVKDLADEIVIVDTGSTDNTIDIAQNYTDKVYTFEWINDFSAARNYSLNKATKEYIMWLDADDIILPEDLEKLKKLKEELDTNLDAVYMYYNTGVDENGKPSLAYLRERIVKNNKGFMWREPVHEYLSYSGKSMVYDAAITHGNKTKSEGRADRNLNIYKEQVDKGIPLSPRAKYYYARELRTHNMTDEAIEMYNTFLDEGNGWREDNITSCYDLSYCYEKKEDLKSMINSLVRSLSYGAPRPDICCRIGDYYRKIDQIVNAIFWYDLALKVPKPDGMGFVREDYLNFTPHICLCICYDKIKRYDTAKYHNEQAKIYKPDHPFVIHNSKYFDKIFGI